MSYAKMKPKNGKNVLQVLVVGRVSTPNQPITNIEAGYEYAEKVIKDIYEGQYIVKRLGEQGSGMLVERQTILEAMELITSGWPDVVLMEDVSKSYRNPRWIYTFVQDCVDHEVRVIAPGDVLDTWDENWEVTLGAAALRHGLHIPDTRRRIRRTSSKSFAEGGMVLRIRGGYRKLSKEEAASGLLGPKGLRMAKLPEWTPIIQELRQMVMAGSGGAALETWMVDHDPLLPPPPYSKKKRWTADVILSLLRDPILYGLRQFPKVRHEPRFGDGKHKRKKNPSPQRNVWPTLAHLTEAEFTAMNEKLDSLSGKDMQASGTESPRHNVPRHKTLTPLQHARCAACNDVYYPVGKGCIKCSNALKHMADGCWNHVQVDCRLVRQALVDLLISIMDRHPQGRETFNRAAWEQIEHVRRRGRRSLGDLDKEIANLGEQAQRLADAIATGGKLASLVEKLKTVETARKSVETRRKEAAESAPQDALPSTKEQFAIDRQAALTELAGASFEFAALLRKIMPKFVIQPVQAVDSGQVHPRGLITVDLSPLCIGGDDSLQCEPEHFVVDFFEPPVHIRHMKAVMDLRQTKAARNEKHSLSIIAQELHINRMTVKRALRCAELMVAEGLNEPYRILTAAPQQASRWKPRSKHSATPANVEAT